ncbi:hypothetical protein [Atopobium sp. oral taxon 416]|nr:hypothetical protein [Atopobium sp. oral taxon 416]QUC02915.1 hypothetical protein J4859_13035 [Atopobium sp. oral taxon 416]
MADLKHSRKFSGEFKRQIAEFNDNNKSLPRDRRQQRHRQLDPCLKQPHT